VQDAWYLFHSDHLKNSSNQMVFDFLSFFVGFLLLLLLFIVLISHKKDNKLNLFFLIIIAVAGLQRFLHGLEVFGLVGSFFNPFQENLIFPFFKFAGLFLFFENLLLKTTSYKKIILHFLFPLVFAFISTAFKPSLGVIQVVFLLFTTVYLVFTIQLVWKYVFSRKSIKETLHFQSIKLWVYALLAFFILFFLLSNYLLLTSTGETMDDKFPRFYAASSVLWFLFVVYILKNPLLLHGEQLLLQKLNSFKKEEVAVWKFNKKEPTDLEDLEVEKKVRDKVDEIIFAIKKNEKELLENFVLLPSLKEFAFRLNYPQSHIKYVFKYYAYCSFNEYQNILKIKYAQKLIKSGYLDSHTIDSLSLGCLFTHRSTFYKTFKKLTGYTPTEYQLALKD
jgi:AraC-like DNA-binding protein